MILSHRIRLIPTSPQVQAFTKACGVSRYTYNWALDQANRYYQKHGRAVKSNVLNRYWNKVKPSWVYDSPKDANHRPFTDLRQAFIRFSKKKANKPKFKKKNRCRDSFYLCNDVFQLRNKSVRLPRIGFVKLTETLRFQGKIISATISREADHWFISIAVEADHSRSRIGNATVGVDVGITPAFTLSTGEQFLAPKPLKRFAALLKRRARQFSRKQRNSNRRAKARITLAKLHARIKHIRRDFLHKLTSRLCRENQTIVIEDLNIANWCRNKRFLSKCVPDIGLGEFYRQLEYKTLLANSTLIKAPLFYPSTRTCSYCGAVHPTRISPEIKIFTCLVCNHTEDRDVNAAKNLRNLATKPKHFTVPPARGKLTLVDKTALAPRLDSSDQSCDQTSLVETRTHSLVETG